LIKDYYCCEKCGVISWEDVNFASLDAYAGPDDYDLHCGKCGGMDVTEQHECPVHGVDAPDGYGNCAKC
jgi:hypothetical protein